MNLTTVVLRHPDPARARQFVGERDRIEAAQAAGKITAARAEAEMGKIAACGEALAMMGFLPEGALQGPIYDGEGNEIGTVLAGDVLIARELMEGADVVEIRE